MMPKRLLYFLRPKDGDWPKFLGGLGVTAGFLWGAWVFVFQEILRPAVAPVNISLALEIKRLKPISDAVGNPQPVVLRASAKNSSKKILTIRKTFWVAHAIALPHPKGNTKYTEDQLINQVNEQMSLGRAELSLSGSAASRYQRSSDEWQLVGFGPLFDANEIRPEEEVKVQRIVLVPKLPAPADYKLLKVMVVIPSFSKRTSLANEDLVRVLGVIGSPTKSVISVGFCQEKRTFRQHGLRWFFDKFSLPQDRFGSPVFREPASRYCPNWMTVEQREKAGAQVFASSFEIPLDVEQASGS